MPNLGVPVSNADIPTGLKCVKVYIPDGTDIHLYALRGQLSNLGKAWWWDTGGDVDLARTIAGWWIAASEATDLTIACEDCDMAECNVNVNVSCGCGGGIPTTILCYDQNGNPIITPQPPVDPTVPNPVGTDWPVDPNSDPAPDGFGDWTTFDVEACAAANGVWQAAYFMVTLAEGAIDLLATILALMAFVVAELPAVITTVISGSGVLKYAEGLVRILLSEQATDILNEIKTWLVDNKQEIVCTIFQYRHDIPGMQIELVRMLHAWLYATLTLDIEEEAAIIEFGRSIFPLNLLLAYFFQFQVYMESSDPIDCSYCFNPSAGINLYQFEFINIESNSFVSAPTFSGNELSLVSGRTALNPTCRVRFNPNLPFGFSVGTGNAGCQAILMEVVSTSGDAQYIFPDGIVDSSQRTFIQPGLVLWKFQELQGQNVTGDELALWVSGQTLLFTIQDDRYPVELTELRDHVSIYTYDKDANISLRFWFVVLVTP